MARPKRISDGELLEAARDVFLRDGPKTAVTQIASRLGVSAAALFQRVGSKTQLMLLALLPGIPPTLHVLAQEPSADRPITAQLHEHLAELMVFLKAVVPSLIVLRAAGIFPPPRAPKRRARGSDASTDRPRIPTPIALRDQLGAWLTVAQAQGRIIVQDPHACAEGILGAMEARCFNAHVGGENYVRGNDADFLSTLISGLMSDLELPSANKGARRRR